ncbi:MAG TPA: type II toxin-antitoxin system PemK/MazF family toxin [Pseudonocardiaceae bacterium]|nr:type II toxin-antitoxin system PemK/MazF family toxin [Pseudonocardiaceae bacterium]
MSAEYPLVKRGELWRLQTPISAANRVVLIISDTDFDRHRNQVLTCDVISTDPGGPPLTVRLAESDPIAGWVIGPQIASTFKGYLAERLGEVRSHTMMQVDAVLRAVLRLP